MSFNLLPNECDYENCKDHTSTCTLSAKPKHENIHTSMYDKCSCTSNWHVTNIINE